MFKKLAFASAIAVAAMGSQAAMAAGHFDGFYAGGELTRDAYDLKTTGDTDQPSLQATVHGSATGIGGNAVAGYGKTLENNLYVGGELNVGTSSAKNQISFSNGEESDLKAGLTYGADFVPGYYLNDNTMVFGRIGVARTKFTADDKTDAISEKKTLTGARFGAGLQTEIAENLALRGEYNYVNYKKNTADDGSTFKPTNNQFKVGLVYYFN